MNQTENTFFTNQKSFTLSEYFFSLTNSTIIPIHWLILVDLLNDKITIQTSPFKFHFISTRTPKEKRVFCSRDYIITWKIFNKNFPSVFWKLNFSFPSFSVEQVLGKSRSSFLILSFTNAHYYLFAALVSRSMFQRIYLVSSELSGRYFMQSTPGARKMKEFLQLNALFTTMKFSNWSHTKRGANKAAEYFMF